ncbi:MAG TPA: TlpA disulfide reductase family protein [Usitatibacteraceae bacterium]|nr:TlpA disulfide reductase family protein [Usitatibacteraceae bacterium]
MRKAVPLNWLMAIASLSVWLLSPVGAHCFDLKDVDGHAQRLSELKGKWVVVNFWATWCAPCVKEIPDIAAFGKEHGAKVRVIGIALDWDDEKQVRAFARKVGHTYPLVLGNDVSEKTFGKVKGLPTTIVYTPDGKIAYQKTGTVTRELLTRVIKGEKVS